MDNYMQVSWYNVPQNIRGDKVWPHCNNYTETGLDPNCPKTQFENIGVIDGLSYIQRKYIHTGLLASHYKSKRR